MAVVVSTPSRLHFGLLRFEQAAGPSYGGLGMMIAEPRWEIELDRADKWSAEGVGAERAVAAARRVLAGLRGDERPEGLRLRIRSAVPAHQGFGGGTQLALAVAAGVRELLRLPPGTAQELAASVGRGRRSAVGAHGFVHGGFIWETGRQPGEPLGRLAARIALPETWRVVLIGSQRQSGLSGQPEMEAFDALPPVPPTTTERLRRIAEEQIIPAAESARIEPFGEGVHEYGRLAGECFASVQGGPYASPEIAECVRTVRALGVAGVGQSSWGPTVFAVTESREQAEQLVESLRRRLPSSVDEFQITAINNHGAVIKHVNI